VSHPFRLLWAGACDLACRHVNRSTNRIDSTLPVLGVLMSIYLEKLLPVFVFPLGLALALCLTALGLSVTHRHRAARILLAIVAVGLWIASMPAFAGLITATLEEQHPAIAVAAAPVADVIVVLGGGIASSGDREFAEATLGKAADRLGQAYALWRAGKGKVILISGGNLPWDNLEKPEAELAAGILEEVGVPPEDIIIEGASRNTHENAVNTAALWREKGFRTGFLVTSAAHMPRALATFHAAGLDLMPWPAAFQIQGPLVQNLFDLLPDATALAMTSSSTKEWLGLIVYRLQGWA
jgi:uncharacterized SAM-binding protein YcdF (DUF218 family)